MPDYYYEGDVPQVQDNELRSLQKIVSLMNNGAGGGLHGTGVPDAGTGNNGQTYVDDDTGNFYVKSNGGWVLVTGVGSLADAQVFRSTSAPAGSPGVNVAIHYQTTTGKVWIWNGSSWDLIIS